MDEYEKKQNINNNNENKKQHHFQVKNTPNGFFDLFNKVSDTYIYEKKFCCDLPQNIIPPKSLHYPLCLENLCKTDLLTMNFDLKNYGEILTDPKLNTLIHEDFINNALEIVFPNLTKFSDKKTEKDVEFKNDILNIIERNDEVLEEKPKILLEKPYYLRSSTFFRPSLSNFNDYEKKKSNKNINKENKKNEINIVKYIENSFKLVENIKEGFVHPKNNKKIAKKVYDILPMIEYLPFKINQYMFPNDPIKEIELNKKIEIPKNFIIKKKNNLNNNNNNEHNNNLYNKNNENEYELDDFSLFKNEKAKDQILDENKNYATYYSHEKDYSLIKSHDYENFNRYLLFKDNIKNTIGVLLTNDKITLKKQNFSKNKNYDNNDDENMNFLNQKRERDLIIMPKNLEEETINKIKKYYKNIGMEYNLNIKNIDDIDFSQIEGVKNIKNEEEEEINNLNNYDYNNDNNKENEFNEDEENNENDYNNDLENENKSENKMDEENEDENFEEHTPNANENEEEDALFEDDVNNNNDDDNNNEENNENNLEENNEVNNENEHNNENKNEVENELKNKNIINDE